MPTAYVAFDFCTWQSHRFFQGKLEHHSVAFPATINIRVYRKPANSNIIRFADDCCSRRLQDLSGLQPEACLDVSSTRSVFYLSGVALLHHLTTPLTGYSSSRDNTLSLLVFGTPTPTTAATCELTRHRNDERTTWRYLCGGFPIIEN